MSSRALGAGKHRKIDHKSAELITVQSVPHPYHKEGNRTKLILFSTEKVACIPAALSSTTSVEMMTRTKLSR
uniref:Uncharacterized protein n=1 Tax=Arundo donax TaxID=35708 RepID=A0A0A9E899_ARUDO